MGASRRESTPRARERRRLVSVRSASWLLIATGCNQISGLDPTTVRDLEPPACSTVQFGSPVELDQFDDGDREVDPQLSSDGSELWYVSNTTGTSNRYLLFRGVRSSDTGPFVGHSWSSSTTAAGTVARR
jgi:hypothetical protein